MSMDWQSEVYYRPSVWLLGVSVSVALGGVIVYGFEAVLKWHMGMEEISDPDPKTKGFPGWLTGAIERIIFTTWIGFAGPNFDVASGMFAWVAFKLAANWHRRRAGATPVEKVRQIRRGWLAMMMGVISMLMAFVGGWIMWRMHCATYNMTGCPPS